MAVEAVVFDVSDTLVDFSTGDAAEGVIDAVARLRSMGVRVVVIGNHNSAELLTTVLRAGIAVDEMVGRDVTKKAKGSPAWGEHICRVTGLRPNQLMLVGDQHLDMVTGVQSGMVYAHAAWVRPAGQYGLVAPSPAWIPAVVGHIFRRRHPWYWAFDHDDGHRRQVKAHTLIDAGGDNADPARVALLRLLKDEHDSMLGLMPLSEFVMLSMLASVYSMNLFGGVDYWTTYPGHDGKPNAIMGTFLDVATKLFRHRYAGDLFDRHRLALRSRVAWGRGGALGARRNQLDTMRLRDTYRGKLDGKRVLVLDNFLTRGYSTEMARNLLLEAGCAEVIVACVGKYGQWMHMMAPPGGAAWDPFGASAPPAEDFSDTERPGRYDPAAMTEFRASFDGIRAASW